MTTPATPPAVAPNVLSFLASINLGAIEKGAAVVLLPYVVAGVNKIINDKPTLDAWLANQNSSIGALAVSFLESNLKLPPAFAALGGIIDAGIAAAEPEFAALAATEEQSLETLAISLLQSLPLKVAAYAGVTLPPAPSSAPAPMHAAEPAAAHAS